MRQRNKALCVLAVQGEPVENLVVAVFVFGTRICHGLALSAALVRNFQKALYGRAVCVDAPMGGQQGI